MAKNVGTADRVARIVIGLGIALLILVGGLDEVAAIVAGVIAAYLLLSGLFARCLVYSAGGIDTTVQEQPYSTTDDRAGL